jgi:hypothetical protein
MPARIYPTGVVEFNPEKCWNGFTLFQAALFEGREFGAYLIDMNGQVVKKWPGLEGFPNKMLPGGYLMGNSEMRDPKYGHQDMVDLVQVDWDGNVVWKFDHYDFIRDPEHQPQWMARQHHDYQREGNPVGYYVPGMEALTDRGKTLVLSHKNMENAAISRRPLIDDAIFEVTWDGRLTWEWHCTEHFDEMGFSEEARRVILENPNSAGESKVGDWMHINSISWLGPNPWFDKGDIRFHPDNIIWSGRQTNIIAIMDKNTGKIVWRLGPDYTGTREIEKLGWIIGQHHAHMIPAGLPGAGNILVFDNGGSGGYGAPNPGAPEGANNVIRDYSRVIEFNPLTLEMVWQYPPPEKTGFSPMRYLKLYSRFISSAQRLPNGNTLIAEGGCGRLIEVATSGEIVWEYVNPYYGLKRQVNHIYRAYRVPYFWAPRLKKPEEIAVRAPINSEFRVLSQA